MVHQVGDDLAGGHHVVEEGSEITRRAAYPALFLDNELRNGGAVVHGMLPKMANPGPGLVL
jgi:hypothetical protein